MIDPVDRRQARGDTGGEDRLIERQQIVCRNAGVQAQIDTVNPAQVLTIASAAPPFASRLEPTLKPNQPTQSSAAPTRVSVIECGAMFSLP